MEIIAALVAELLFPIFAVFASAIASLASGLAEAIFGVTLSIWKPKEKEEEEDRPKNKFLRKLTYIGLGCFTVISLLFVLVNLFWFESAFSWMINRIEGKHGIQIQYEKLEGNLLQSKLVLHGMDIQRQNHPASNFELRSEKVEASFSTLKILMSSQIDSLSISGVNGAFVKNPTPKKDWKLKLPKNFEIKDLHLSQINFDLTLQNQEKPVPIYLDEWHSPFHSRYFIFQFLFRGNGNGSVCEQNFKVMTQRMAQGGKLSWQFKNLPLSLIQNQLPKPMPWATEGSFDLEVSDEWQSEPQLSLDTRWSITLKDHEFTVPETAKKWDYALAKILESFDPMPINFSLKVNADQFEGKADLGATQIWPMILEKMADQITAPGGDQEKSKQSIQKGIELGKDLLDKARKKAEE